MVNQRYPLAARSSYLAVNPADVSPITAAVIDSIADTFMILGYQIS